jgi:protein involved in polysaccharide export with SLBB domain
MTGTAFFPGLGRISVAGLSIDSLESMLNTRYATQVVRGAAVQVTMTRELTLYGSVRAPGVYAASPGMTILGFVAKSGGQTSAGASPEAHLETADGRRFLLPREARLGTIEMHRTDALVLAEQGFLQRNASTIGAASLFVSMLSTLVSVALLVSR